jgi:O-antigen/teichoic acid export membrane protein
LVSRTLGFLLVPFYTRYLTRPEYGTVSIIYSLIPFLIVIYTYGMETGYFYFSNKEKDEKEVEGTSFLSLIYSSILLSILLMLCSPWLAGLVDNRSRIDYIIYVALILLFDNIAVLPFAWLRKHDRSVRFAMLKMVNSIINIFLNFCYLVFFPYLMMHSGDGLFHDLFSRIFQPGDPVKYILIANVISSFIMLFLLIPEIRKIKLTWSMEIWKKMLKYSWPLVILGLAGVINETFDRTLLKLRLPDLYSINGLTGDALKKVIEINNNYKLSQIGIYSACYKISIFMTLAIQSFRYAAEPFFFKQMRETNSSKMYAVVLKYFSFVTSFIFLGVLLYFPIVMKIIGKDFRDAEDIVPILLLANLFLGMFIYLSQWYKQTEKILYGAYVSIGGAVVTLIINFAFIPTYGYMAAAWATLAAYACMAIVSFILGQRFFPVDYPILRIGFYIWFALVLYIVSRWMIDNFFGGWTLGAYFFNTLLAGAYLIAFLVVEQPSFILKYSPIRSKKARISNR